MQGDLKALAQKIGELEAESDEHRHVKTLSLFHAD